MKNNNEATSMPTSSSDQLRNLAGDLTEVHTLLSLLCTELGGGGIVPAGQLEPVIAKAVPKLRNAVASMNALAAGINGEDCGDPLVEKNPLLM